MHFEQEIKDLKRKVDYYKVKYLERNSGVAFITFNHSECVQECIVNFKTDIVEITKG
jgi:hypothetical protein